tara:strand:+ start:231 stop:509 length:279 start_codon:yes stop_codon:yes gene_type:complete
MILVQTLLNARLGPVRQRLERTDVRLLVYRCFAPENILGILTRLLPRTMPYQSALGNLASKYMLFECKVQHIACEYDASLQQLLETTHGFLP